MLSAPAYGFDKWTKTNTALQLTWTAIHAMDWHQTREIADNPNRWCEVTNPFLGSHPSKGEVDAYFATALVVNTGIAYVLPHPYREIFQGVTIGMSGQAVFFNYKFGIGR